MRTDSHTKYSMFKRKKKKKGWKRIASCDLLCVEGSQLLLATGDSKAEACTLVQLQWPSVRCKGSSASTGASRDSEVSLLLGLEPTQQSKRDGHADRDSNSQDFQ